MKETEEEEYSEFLEYLKSCIINKTVNKVSKPILTKCPLWKIRWAKLPKGWNKWVLWQYTNGQMGSEPHSVKGIRSCDRSKFNGTLEKLREFWSSEGIDKIK